MGLDSIELVVEIERYFGITIPDSEAEKILTVQSMVDTVARHLNITDDGTGMRDNILEKVNQALLKLELTSAPLTLTETISTYLSPDNKDTWIAFKRELQLNVPKPNTIKPDSGRLIDKVKNMVKWTPMYDWSSITVDQFVTAICASNHEALLDRNLIKCRYEIYVAVTAITVDKIGVDYYEVSLDKSFTQDLGVD